MTPICDFILLCHKTIASLYHNIFQLLVFICFWVSSVTLEHGQFRNGSHISSVTSKEARKQNTLRKNLPAPNCTSPCERIQDQIL